MINDSLRIHLSVQSYRLLVEYTENLYLYLFRLSANIFQTCIKTEYSCENVRRLK